MREIRKKARDKRSGEQKNGKEPIFNRLPYDFTIEVQTEFDKIVTERLDKSKELLLVKGKEYVRGHDRFHNFNRSGVMNNQLPTRALHGMLTKHLVSYLDMLDDIDKGILPAAEYVNEKMGDIIVYFLLQEALIKERYLKKWVIIYKANQRD